MQNRANFFLLVLLNFSQAYVEFNEGQSGDNLPVSPCPIPRAHGAFKGYENQPCGSKLDISDENSRISLAPGWQTVRWTENAEKMHGSVFRIALSQDGADVFDDCVLLDNIPHHDHTPSDAVPYAVSIEIPDVECKECALQIVQIGFNESNPCFFGEECPADEEHCTPCDTNRIFFSCANVEITGNLSRSDGCPAPPGKDDGWPFGFSTNNNYEMLSDVGAWNDDGTIDLDNDFSSPVGPCGDTLLASKGDQGSGISTGAAVAITFAVLFVIIVMCAFIYAFLRRRNSGSHNDILLQGNDNQSEYRNIKQETVRGSSMDMDEEDDSRPLPPGWEEFFADDGNPYYYCEATGQTQWERP